MDELGFFELPDHGWKKVEHEPYLPLSTERHGDYIHLSHTFIQEGDLMRDPEVTVLFNTELRAATAIDYTNHPLGIYQVVRTAEWVNEKEERDLNKFLLTWLKNIKQQGFDIKGTPVKE